MITDNIAHLRHLQQITLFCFILFAKLFKNFIENWKIKKCQKTQNSLNHCLILFIFIQHINLTLVDHCFRLLFLFWFIPIHLRLCRLITISIKTTRFQQINSMSWCHQIISSFCCNVHAPEPSSANLTSCFRFYWTQIMWHWWHFPFYRWILCRTVAVGKTTVKSHLDIPE